MTLNDLIRYDQNTGKLYWLERSSDHFEGTKDRSAEWIAKNWNSKYAGKEALTANGNGYKHGCINGKRVRAHIVIWELMTGLPPVEQIDHINGDRSDNRWINLRLVTNKENNKNKSINSNNTSGFTGVSLDAQTNKWRACIMVDGKTIQLGRFANIDDAINARIRANIKYGFHENHGRKK